MTATMTIEMSEEHDEGGAGPADDRTAADLALARRMLQALRHRQDQRRSKVDRLREAIRSNSYENPLKLSVAVDRLVERAGGLAGEA